MFFVPGNHNMVTCPGNSGNHHVRIAFMTSMFPPQFFQFRYTVFVKLDHIKTCQYLLGFQ